MQRERERERDRQTDRQTDRDMGNREFPTSRLIWATIAVMGNELAIKEQKALNQSQSRP